MKAKKSVFVKEILIIILGNALIALAYLFILRSNLMTGGMGGIAIIFEEKYGWNISLVILILTWGLFLIGLFVIGKKFALKTLASSIFYPLFVYLFMNYIDLSVIAEVSEIGDRLLYAIVSGVVSGCGLGLVFKIDGSTGGVDIISLIISKRTKIRLDWAVFLVDGAILIFGLIMGIAWENIVIGLISAYIASLIIDKVIIGGTQTVVVQVISNKNEAINNYILNIMERGVTFIPAVGGWNANEKKILQTVISKREYHQLIEYIKITDKEAFVISFNAKDIYGNGFSELTKKV